MYPVNSIGHVSNTIFNLEIMGDVMKKLLLCFLVVCMVFGIVACGKGDSREDGVTTLTMPTYRSGENVGARLFLDQVARFNEQYRGVYEILIEETTDGTHVDVIKNLSNQGKLPVLFQFADYTYAQDNFFDGDTLYDFSPWLNENPKIKEIFLQDSLDYVTQESGAVYSLPIAVIRPTGVYVNGNIYTPEKPVTQMSWEEFGKSMAKAGAMYGFQTVNKGWTINLTTSAIMGTLPGGPELLERGLVEKISNFNNDLWIETFRIMKEFYQDAGWPNGLGKDYPDVENAFINNTLAVMPNGQWILSVFDENGPRAGDWSDGFLGSQVRGDYFPGNVAIANPKIYDWYLSADSSEKEIAGALAFLEFICSPTEIEEFMKLEGGTNTQITYSEEFKKSLQENQLMSDFAHNVNESTVYVPYLHEVITDSAMVAISNNIPLLFEGDMTPREFCQEITTFATE